MDMRVFFAVDFFAACEAHRGGSDVVLGSAWNNNLGVVVRDVSVSGGSRIGFRLLKIIV